MWERGKSNGRKTPSVWLISRKSDEKMGVNDYYWVPALVGSVSCRFRPVTVEMNLPKSLGRIGSATHIGETISGVA